MKILVLGATFGTNNMGVSALAAGSIKCVLSQYPEAQVSFLDYGRESSVSYHSSNGQNLAIPLVNMRFSKKFYLRNNIAMLIFQAVLLRFIPFKKFRNWIISENLCLQAIQDADLAAAISGGDSFSDIYGLGRLLYCSLPQMLIILSGKKLVLLPQTYGPFSGKIARTIARWIVTRSALVYSRDLQGLRDLQKLVSLERIPENWSFAYDVAFAIDAVAPASMVVEGATLQRSASNPVVGLNVSGLLLMGGYTGQNMFGLRFDYGEFVRQLIERLIVKKGSRVILIPHVFGSDKESDTSACESLFTEMRDKHPDEIGILRGNYNQSEIKYVIGQCDFFIGSRMHACIAAASQGVPVMAVAYSEKFIGVMQSIGEPSMVADATKLDLDEILEMAEQRFDDRMGQSTKLQKMMPKVRQSALNLFACQYPVA
jgi:colanic acid/amylovoran biosynthesis protein